MVIRGLLVLALMAGVTVATATVASATPGWSAPTAIDNSSGAALLSVSCPTTSFCMALNADSGYLKYNGTTWTTPAQFPDHAHLVALSCASSTLCAGSDGDGDVFTYNGTSWSAADNVDGGTYMSGVSCAPGTTFCVAVAGDTGGDAYVYNGTSWSSQHVIDGAADPGMVGISCATASYCMAIDPQGNDVVTTNGGATWTPPASADGTGGFLTAVSCSSASFCMIVDNLGNAFAVAGSITEYANADEDGASLLSVSCPADGTCVAIDSDGADLRFSGGSWHSPGFHDGEGTPSWVSCAPASSICIMVDSLGSDLKSTDGGANWTTPKFIDDSGSNLSGVSCVSTIFCAAVDSSGNVVTYNGSQWAAPSSIDGNQLDGVSCASSTFCVAVDDAGNGVTLSGTSWSSPAVVDSDGFGLTSVSCTEAPSTFCAAVDTDGNVFTTGDGVSWATTSIDPGNFFTSVSCATAGFCAAVDTAGNGFTFNGTSWSADDHMDGNQVLTSVSCTTTPSNHCTAVDQEGNAVPYDGSWSGPTNIDAAGLTGVSCATATFCQAVDGDGATITVGQANLAEIDPGTQLNAISCPSATFCIAVDPFGDALLYKATPTAVIISKVSPDTGPTTGGTAVTITGRGFVSPAQVDFAGVAATSVVVVNSTTITAHAPAGSAGTVDVVVTETSGSSTVNPADGFTYTVVQSPNTTGCHPSCTNTVSTTLNRTQVTATASSANPSAQVSLVVNTDTLTCAAGHDYPTAVSTMSPTGFNPGEKVMVSETVARAPSTKGVKVCYGATTTATTGTFLPNCAKKKPKAPCIGSLKEQAGSVVAQFDVPASDPRFWTGTGPADLTKFSPTHAAPGGKITLKGKNLTQITAVVIGGAQARILSQSSSKVVVIVPQGASTGLITVTADSGVVTSTQTFTVS
jgi:hypothetical protein